MAGTISDLEYEKVIRRQQKRISELRAELVRYSSTLRQLRRQSLDNHQAALDASTASLAATIVAAATQSSLNVFDNLHILNSATCSAKTANACVPELDSSCVPTFHHASLTKHSKGLTSLGAGAGQSRTLNDGHHRSIGINIRSSSGIERKNGCRWNTRYWTEMEHNLFLHATSIFGPKNYAAISGFVGSRTPKQVRTHAQKYQLRLEREAEDVQFYTNKGAGLSSGEIADGNRNDNDGIATADPREEGMISSGGEDDNFFLLNLLNDSTVATMNECSDKDYLASQDEIIELLTDATKDANMKESRL